jgi:hypothetical protein
MSYIIAAGESFNMTWAYLDQSDPNTWTEEFATEHIEKEFRGWDPQ